MASLLTSEFEYHTVGMTQNFKSVLAAQPAAVKSAFYNNFFAPIANGYSPEELQGKYKPSWMADYVAGPMLQAILQACVKYQAHHYHFGFEYYRSGQDAAFSGDESAGILHTKLRSSGDSLNHILFGLHTAHPRPFMCPLNVINSPLVEVDSLK